MNANFPEGRVASAANAGQEVPAGASDLSGQLLAQLELQAGEQLRRYAEDFGALASDYEALRRDFMRASRDRDKAREMQRAFESIVRALDDFGFVATDALGTVTDANSAATQMLGIPEETLPGSALADLLDASGRAAFSQQLARLAAGEGGGGEGFRSPLQRMPETILHLRAMRVPQPESPGYRVNWLLRPAQAQIADAGLDADVFSALFSKSSHAVIVTDPKGRIVSVNAAFCSITGYEEHEVLGHSPRVLSSGLHDKTFYEGMWRVLQATGEWQGEITNRRKNGEVFHEWLHITASRNAAGELSSYVGMFYDIEFARRAHERIYNLAHYDTLTGLPNRALLHDRLTQTLTLAQRESRCFTVLFLDLDGFKEINDTLGHDVGDEVLRTFAKRLTDCVRASDTVARLGGDEFVILAEGIGEETGARALANKILAALRPPLRQAEQHLHLATSIGAACYPDHGADAGLLLRNADTAMYVSKRAGPNNFRVYSEEFNRGRLERLSLAGALSQALPLRQLHLVYQPQVDSLSGRICGVEALLRWRLPEVGEVSPERFIPIAEDTGLIIPIGAWVLEQACRQLVAWHRQGYPALRMAVNVSARQLNARDFVAQVQKIIADTGVRPQQLELEITESQLMESVSNAVHSLRSLRELGISIAVDDFGTGHSSLARLHSLPIDRLKIDRSFVMAMGERSRGEAIPRAILAMAESLNLTAVAEGVETEAQFQRLKDWNCGEMQGFLFARPLAPSAVTDLLARESLDQPPARTATADKDLPEDLPCV